MPSCEPLPTPLLVAMFLFGKNCSCGEGARTGFAALIAAAAGVGVGAYSLICVHRRRVSVSGALPVAAWGHLTCDPSVGNRASRG